MRWLITCLVLFWAGNTAWGNEGSSLCREYLDRKLYPCPERPPGKWSSPDRFESSFYWHKKWLNSSREYDLWSIERPFCHDYGDLEEADLDGRDFECLSFRNAHLSGATFRGTNLQCVDFTKADLKGAVLTDADLSGADLSGADLLGAKFAGADLSCTNLGSTLLEGVDDLHMVIFKDGGQGSLSQLRERLRAKGLREHERKVNFAIERNIAKHLLAGESLIDRLDGLLRIVFFGGPVGWGLYPFRALTIMMSLWIALAFVYTWVIVRKGDSQTNGIFIVRPQQRLETDHEGAQMAEDIRVERLSVGLSRAILWGLYFSLLSAFSIGWRDLNVGAWLTRIQRMEFYLRGVGWIRTLAGVQSLVSVYLLAIWALSYFGRLFG